MTGGFRKAGIVSSLMPLCPSAPGGMGPGQRPKVSGNRARAPGRFFFVGWGVPQNVLPQRLPVSAVGIRKWTPATYPTVESGGIGLLAQESTIKILDSGFGFP